MRRKDREITDKTAIYEILDRAEELHLGLWDGQEVYVVPLNFVRIGDELFFHSARGGRKLEIMKQNPRVCFEVTGAHHIEPGAKGADCTTLYESVIGWGTGSLITEDDATYEVLRALNRKFGAPTEDLPQAVVQKTAIVQIRMEKLTGKANRGSM